jgi:hypothetical protein
VEPFRSKSAAARMARLGGRNGEMVSNSRL